MSKMTKKQRDEFDRMIAEDEAEGEKMLAVSITKIEAARAAAAAAGKLTEWWGDFLLNVDDHSDFERFGDCAEAALKEVVR